MSNMLGYRAPYKICLLATLQSTMEGIIHKRVNRHSSVDRQTKFVTRHEKTGLMYTKYTYSHYGTYLLFCFRYYRSVNCIRFHMKCCINDESFIRIPSLFTELFKFEFQKCGQILCAHKPYFLMPGHIYIHHIYVGLT